MTNIEFYFNRKTTKPPPTIKKWQENLSRERLGKKTRNTKLQKSQTNTHKKDLYMPPYTHNHSCNAWETSPQWRRQRWSEMAMTVNAARFDRGRTREREREWGRNHILCQTIPIVSLSIFGKKYWWVFINASRTTHTAVTLVSFGVEKRLLVVSLESNISLSFWPHSVTYSLDRQNKKCLVVDSFPSIHHILFDNTIMHSIIDSMWFIPLKLIACLRVCVCMCVPPPICTIDTIFCSFLLFAFLSSTRMEYAEKP